MKKLLLLLVGLALDAFGVAIFVLPYGLIISGSTGIGKILNYFTGLPIAWMTGVANVTLFLLALIFMGKKFAGTIVIGTFTYPIFLGFFQSLTFLNDLTDQPLVAAIFGAIFMGVGTGIVIRCGGSTGGADVVPIILHEKFGWNIPIVLYSLDVLVLLPQVLISTKEGVVLGIFMSLVCNIALDKTLMAGGGEIQLMIFSRKCEEINDALMALDVGSTLFHGKTGYMREERDTILCVSFQRNLEILRSAIMEIDPEAFMTISQVREVSGRGFSLEKKHRVRAS